MMQQCAITVGSRSLTITIPVRKYDHAMVTLKTPVASPEVFSADRLKLCRSRPFPPPHL